MPPLMLLIHVEKARAMQLSFIAMSLGVRVKAVSDGECGQTLGALCGLEDTRKSAPTVKCSEEMLVFAFMEDSTLNALLSALRQTAPVRLKAVLTPSNRGWTCAQLQAELQSEAAAFARMQEGKK